jgi:hypothetical protein
LLKTRMLLNCSEVSNVKTWLTGTPKSVAAAAPSPEGPNSIVMLAPVAAPGVPMGIEEMAKMAFWPRAISAPEALGAMVCLVTLSTPPDAEAGLNTAANVAIEVLLTKS